VGRRIVTAGALIAVVLLCALSASASVASSACSPTLGDPFGPFGRGMPPVRAKIGTGHVLTGVVLSGLDCKPVARARVELWQAGKNGRYTQTGSATVFTNKAGRFRFEGPFPPSYEGRSGHIHLRITAEVHKQLLLRVVPARGAKRSTVRIVLEPDDL
jgi:hypothetical protein